MSARTKPWNEHPPGSQGRVDALVVEAQRLGHSSVTAIALFAGITYEEARSVIARLRDAGRMEREPLRSVVRSPEYLRECRARRKAAS